MPMDRIRNFSIIAHIDHGKSTLADRFLEMTGALSKREMKEQYLDRMDLERERGITIKAQTARLEYRAKSGGTYQFNLIDTPGHVDFSYEVSRSLVACEGVILLVDASQGVQAQTLAHVYQAIEHHLEVILVWNKIDLPSSDVDRARREVEDVIGLDTKDAIAISAKEGTHVSEVLEAVVARIPPPKGSVNAPLKALLFDSWYDPYLGVVCLMRLFDGTLKKGDHIRFMATRQEFEVERVGVLNPEPYLVDELSAGEVGFVAAAIKDVRETKIGDTVTNPDRPTAAPFAGFRIVKPMVFCGIFPTAEQEFDELRDALEKLRLNDASFSFEPETSAALGFGFRCGFLGLLHMEIIQERLEREFQVDVITTAPTVVYKIKKLNGEVVEIDNPSKLPPIQEIDEIQEPRITATIHTPNEYVGAILALCEGRRGKQVAMEFPTPSKVILKYDLPFNEIVFDFYDKLKSVSRGYASLDYEFTRFEASELIKLDMLINGEKVDALSLIVHRDVSYHRGRELAKRMKEVIPRQMFEVAIQASIGNKVIARESLSALRKNVTAKCYGGDITRKRKLLERQKEGKRRMKRVGRVDLPQEAFLAILKVE
ncbi:MAG TPA: translation elongation factor 4 [Bdellovibrionota bacterium]|nr:translation elongation factor 4 [Bdellovibrionota bacterium]